MDTPTRGTEGAQTPPADKQPSLDPLRRVFQPIEKRTAKGTIVFRTFDDVIYARLADGSIRRAIPKENGKEARKRRQRVREKS